MTEAETRKYVLMTEGHDYWDENPVTPTRLARAKWLCCKTLAWLIIRVAAFTQRNKVMP